MNRISILILTIIILTHSCEQQQERLSQEELDGKSLAELRIMRNEIFAKHGYIFQAQDLKDYFSNMSWYKPELNDVNHLLTEVDKSNIDIIIKQETLLKSIFKSATEEIQLSLSRFKMDPPDSSQKVRIKNFLNNNMKQIISDFNSFWNKDLGLISYHYNIQSQSIYTQANLSLAVVKLEVIGRRKNSMAAVSVNYIMNLENKVRLIYASGFFQPECGTPDFNILSVSTLQINEKNYPTIERESKKHACCGQASELQIDWLVFPHSFKDQPVILEKYFHNDNLMDCGPTNPLSPESRATNFFFVDSELIAEVTFLEDESKIKSERRKITFSE